MALFKRAKPPSFNDPALDDATWLEQGETRFEQLVVATSGDADELVAGARARLTVDDPAAAVHFLARAVERLEAEYVAGAMARRQPGEADRLIIGSCWSTFTSVNRQRPAAPIGPLAEATAGRLTTMATAFEAVGRGAELVEPFRNVAADLLAVAASVVPPPPPGAGLPGPPVPPGSGDPYGA